MKASIFLFAFISLLTLQSSAGQYNSRNPIHIMSKTDPIIVGSIEVSSPVRIGSDGCAYWITTTLHFAWSMTSKAFISFFVEYPVKHRECPDQPQVEIRTARFAVRGDDNGVIDILDDPGRSDRMLSEMLADEAWKSDFIAVINIALKAAVE